MIKLNSYWTKIKQELFSIIFLSMLQVWWSFNFPAFIRLGYPWSNVLPISMSIVGIICIIGMFAFIDKLTWTINLDYLNEAPYGELLKKIEITLLIIVMHIAFLLMWQKNFCHMTNIHYGMMYFNFMTTYILLYRAKYRNS